MILTTDFRVATRDVDAVFDADRAFVRRAAESIADEFGWPATWLNDGVKGFLSAADSAEGIKALFRTYPSEDKHGLRVFVATPAYLFAMKCLAMRAGGVESSQDVVDIRALGGLLGIDTADAALRLVSRYYPAERIAFRDRGDFWSRSRRKLIGGTSR